MITRFPDPYFDEIFYSMCARYYDKLQYSNKAAFLRDLFDKNMHPSVDLPHRLGYFVDKLPLKRFFTVDHLIDHHTLFPLYDPFLSEERSHQLREKMVTGNEQLLHKTVGRASADAPHLNWLRYCPLCAKDERVNFGECYWHRLHQLPGVEICPIHKVFLENSEIRMQSHLREFIPAEHAVMTVNARIATSSPFYESFLNIAEDAFYLLQDPVKPLSSHLIREQYHALLAQHGFITAGGQVRIIELLQSFLNYYPHELLVRLHCELKLTRHLHNAWVSIVIHQIKFQHPLYHILLIRFLESSAESFLSKLIEAPKPFGSGAWPCLNPVCEQYRKKCITTCQIATGVKGRPFARFTCTCGFSYCRSGPDISPEDVFKKDSILSFGSLWEMKLREMWSNRDLSLSEIARRLGVDAGTINRFAVKLHLPVPRDPIRSSHFGKKRGRVANNSIAWYQEQWLDLIKEYPQESMRALKQRKPGIHDHLQKYNREWLVAHCPTKKLGGRPISRSKLPNSSREIVSFREENSNDLKTTTKETPRK